MTTSEREVVAALGQALAQRIGEPRYNFWFARNTKFRWDERLLVVGVPNHFYQEWLQDTFGEQVRAAAGDVFGRAVEVRFAIDPELFQVARRAQAEVGEATPQVDPAAGENRGTAPAPAPKPAVTGRPKPPVAAPRPGETPGAPNRARRWRRLVDFVVGPSNRVAHASAVSVVEMPGQAANPLVLHGPVGTGKTHLLEGIYAGLRKGHPDWHVCFITSEDFTNRFVNALRHGKLAAFRKEFRDYDVLLVDDLHFLARKKATHEEFLHTLDALLSEGRQVVVTCDCHPKLAEEFTPELIDRLVGGVVWGLSPPEVDTRLSILQARCLREGITVPEEVLRRLAGALCGNVRELEGALHSLQHYSRVVGRPIDWALAREALSDLLRHSVRVVQLADVDRAVCAALHLETGALQSKVRGWAVSHPRMLAMYLARRHTAAAYSEIGRYFGGRNHSTVVAAEKKVRQWLEERGTPKFGDATPRLLDVIARVERELRR